MSSLPFDLETIAQRLRQALPQARLEIVRNDSPSRQDSLLVDNESALEAARFLRDDPALRLDYLSNVTGVDWLEKVTREKVKTKKLIDGAEKEVEEIREVRQGGFLEAVYHLYSMSLKHGPLILRFRTRDRAEGARLTSLTPVWRAAEFQEREIFDLYGIKFEGHPDLRRILMWEDFVDYPMRRDYRETDDYEYEPTPHGEILAQARRHYPPGTP